ncbi:hypothetical protein [Actinokineospora sp. NBRC 105648]|uniref:hypothetical protein n=1 Tax=Actinokineospora sp. NBRC 105648 TaxID=3032206 RepID=UPI0024A33EAA|nr:hypothetical protein [Actinokineospora sp. NBRC 105648]GLZ37139.1 hypothetical protein Acsp05_07640 [Actinokineospora sp. NBRC 105648]
MGSTLLDAVRGLVGARVTDVGRTADMVEVGFDVAGAEHRLHVQCAFRLVRGAQILLGTTDLGYAENRSDTRAAAFENRTTMFDRNARRLTDRFAVTGYEVVLAEVSEIGAVVIEASDAMRFEVVPTGAGPAECWRLFERGSDVHHVYPESADHDEPPDCSDDGPWPSLD